MKKVLLFLFIILTSLLTSSCGVMFGGSKFQGTIVAKDHPNAEIYVNGEKEGVGEVSKLYRRNIPLEIELREEGCEPQKKTFHETFRTGNFILSAISWGIIGIGIDLGTGASYKPDHKEYEQIERKTDKNYTFTINYNKCERISVE